MTTCIAFIPLFFFEGRWGRVNHFIPPMIFFMLGASLFESFFILPGHMALPSFSFLKKFSFKYRNLLNNVDYSIICQPDNIQTRNGTSGRPAQSKKVLHNFLTRKTQKNPIKPKTIPQKY